MQEIINMIHYQDYKKRNWFLKYLENQFSVQTFVQDVMAGPKDLPKACIIRPIFSIPDIGMKPLLLYCRKNNTTFLHLGHLVLLLISFDIAIIYEPTTKTIYICSSMTLQHLGTHCSFLFSNSIGGRAINYPSTCQVQVICLQKHSPPLYHNSLCSQTHAGSCHH